MSSTPITPYQGPMTVTDVPRGATLEQNIAIRADASVKFSEVFHEYQTRIKTGKNPLDPTTQNSLDELTRNVRLMGYKPATVINLNPMVLDFGAGNLYMRSIVIPACAPGQQFSKHVIRHWRHESFPNEDGSRGFRAIFPIRLATEFVREYSMKENYGGGVIICEGDINPEKISDSFEVETYDRMGRPITTPQGGWEEDQEGNKYPVMQQIPVKRALKALIKEARDQRNAFYMEKVRKAERDYRLPEGRGKMNVTEVHVLMAEVLHADGFLPVMPDWNLTSRMEQGLSEVTCKACGNPPRTGAYKCQNCGNILNPLEAYKDFAIEWGHAKMEMLTSDELEEAELIRMEREDAKKPKSEGGKKGGKKE